MAKYSFNKLLCQLPDCDKFTINSPLPDGVSYIDNGTPTFIPPDLTDFVGGIGEGHIQVLIVSAPGAVGKSTLARQIAYEKAALVWDLASAPEVGGGSLNGTIGKSFGMGSAQDFLEFMTEGLQFIVIDALDEGRIKVNQNSFQRMLEDIGHIAKESKDICFVLLGRTQITETAWEVLNEVGANASMISIEPFSRQQANQYIDNNVPVTKRTQSFYKCRDLIFEKLAFSVSEGSSGDSATDFLHYPPVLDVIATLLKNESNLFELENSLTIQTTETSDDSIQLLQNVIVRILEREQNKVLPTIQRSLNDRAKELSWSNWKSLYSSEEQCERLLWLVFGKPKSIVPDGLHTGLRPLYENSTAIRAALPEHPFFQVVGKLTNRVFESYLFSKALLDEYGDEIKQLVTKRLLRQETLPTRLLSAFYLHGGNLPADSKRTIMPEHLGIIYDSLLSAESTRSRVEVTVDGSDPINDPDDGIESIDVDFEFLTSDSEGRIFSISDPISFSVPINEDSIITFATHLRNASIVVPCTVEIGLAGREMTIGPRVQVVADRLAVQSETLIVVGRTKHHVGQEDASVILEANSCDSTSLINPLRVFQPNEFRVSWSGAEQYPWTNYRFQRSEEAFADDETLRNVYMRFKKIATPFRSSGKGSLARSRKKIESERVLRGPISQTLLEKLKSDSILTIGDGGFRYFWNSEIADTLLGISWQDLSEHKIPPRLRLYLSNFIEANKQLF